MASNIPYRYLIYLRFSSYNFLHFKNGFVVVCLQTIHIPNHNSCFVYRGILTLLSTLTSRVSSVRCPRHQSTECVRFHLHPFAFEATLRAADVCGWPGLFSMTDCLFCGIVWGGGFLSWPFFNKSWFLYARNAPVVTRHGNFLLCNFFGLHSFGPFPNFRCAICLGYAPSGTCTHTCSCSLLPVCLSQVSV